MNINTYNQLYNFLTFIITGILIGILFDFFRILRKTFKTPDFITYIEDVIFWILVGIILLFAIFNFNNGEIRSYIFIGLVIGITIYIITISKYFINISVIIFNFIKNLLYLPIIIFKKIITKPFSIIFYKIRQKFKSKNIKNMSNNILNDNLPNN